MTAMMSTLIVAAEADRLRIDVTVPPHEEHAGDRGDEGAERERERALQRDAVAQRAHAHGLVAHALQRDAEGRAYEVADEQVEQQRDDERQVVEAVRVLSRSCR